MGPLVGLGHDIDLLNASLFVHLAREPELPRPLMRQPRRALLWIRILVVLAFEAKRFISPRQLEETKHLLKRLAIDAVGLTLVADGSADMDQLGHLVEPAGLVAAGKTHKGAPFGQLIEPRNF